MRFCDVDPATFCVDAGDLARVLAEEGGKVAAVVVVHYAGHVRQARTTMTIVMTDSINDRCVWQCYLFCRR